MLTTQPPFVSGPDIFRNAFKSSNAMTYYGCRELSQIAPRVDKSKTGAVLFWSGDYKMVVLPPFPVGARPVVGGLGRIPGCGRCWQREYVLGVVLLRLGRFAVGVFQDKSLLSSKTDTRYVKGRHSAGGQSQKRFERIREKQVQEIFQKTCSVVKEQFAPFEDYLDYIILGGERFTLQGLLKRCDYPA